MQDEQHRKRVVGLFTAAPFLALVLLFACLLIHVAISNGLAHQDCGFSADPFVTLPNGYVLGSHNTYDGYLKAPGFDTDVAMDGPGYVRSIIDLQFSDQRFTGTQYDFKTCTVCPFVFDTRTRAFQSSDFNAASCQYSNPSGSRDVDNWASAETSAQSDINSYWVLYAQYRHQWPNYVLAALIILGESALFFFLKKRWNHQTLMLSANGPNPICPNLP